MARLCDRSSTLRERPGNCDGLIPAAQ